MDLVNKRLQEVKRGRRESSTQQTRIPMFAV